MSTAPSQRRGLPQPYAAQSRTKESAASAVAFNRSSNGAAASNTHPPAAAPPSAQNYRRPANMTSSGVHNAASQQQQQQQQTQQQPEDRSYFARPAAATFPWSSRPNQPQDSNYSTATSRPLFQQANFRNSDEAADASSTYADLSATPEKQRRVMGHEDAEEVFGSTPPALQAASQYADPRSGGGPAPQPGDSSLVFALSEDSELKVLASRVGAPPQQQPATAPAPAAPGGASAPASAVSVAVRANPQPPPVVSRGGGTAPAPGARRPGSDVPAAAAAAVPTVHHNPGNGGPLPHQLQPHTPSAHRAATEGPDGENSVPSGPKPSVQVAYPPPHSSSAATSVGSTSAPPQPPTTRVNGPSSNSAFVYRTSPHELRSPPALHVCPGGIPGTGVVVPPTAAAGAGSGGSGARWVAPGGAPTVSLYPAGLPPHGGGVSSASMPLSSAHAGRAGAHAGNVSRSHAASAAPENVPNSLRSLHGKTLSMDGRSQHSSSTPPPSSASAGHPIEKNFTPAQREAVLAEVQQELYLNYSAVPVPPDMINTGDTDERRRRLEQRQKQIIYGKETEGYAKYTCLVPRPCDREYHNPLHAVTPRPEYDCSKRQFDRVLNAWRRQLHQWDDCDLDQPDAKFLPGGHATLLELSLVEAPPSTPTPTHGEQQQQQPPPPPLPPHQQQQQQQPTGVLHSIAHVAAMAHDDHPHHNPKQPQQQQQPQQHDQQNGRGQGRAGGADDVHGDDEDEGVSHTRSPVFTGNTPTSGLYSSSLSMHLNSGRASAMAAAACTPSRPQMPEGAEGPQVDDYFFLHMNSANSRIASPFHPTYSGSSHVAAGAAGGGGGGATSSHHSHHHHSNNPNMGGGYSSYNPTNMGNSAAGTTATTPYHAYGTSSGGAGNGRSSTNSYYQQFMRNNNINYAHHNGGTPGNNYAAHTGLTPAHRPPSRSTMPHHITAIFGSEYELMTPSGPGSPSGMPHNPRSGGSPYRLSEPWLSNRRSPTYQMPGAQAAAHYPAGQMNNGAMAAATANTVSGSNACTPSSGVITAVNSAGTMVMTGTRGESPPQTTELALIPSTSQSSGGGFAQSPYGFRVHSPVQPSQQSSQQQQQQTQVQPQQPTTYATPLTRPQSRPGVVVVCPHTTTSPSRSPIGLPQQQQQQQRVAIPTTMAAATRSRRGSGIAPAPTTWTPPNMQPHVRPSPHTPQLHLAAATPPSTKRSNGQN